METKKVRKQAKAPPVNDTAVPLETIPYEQAVSEGQEIVAKIEAAERGQLRLGELVAKLEKKYGDRTLAKFAEELGIAKCTLDRYQTVYWAWEGKLAPGPISTSYAVLREFATHPEREQIICKNPNLTKREAHELVRKRKYAAEEKQQQEQQDDWLKHNRKWFKHLVALANEASRAADVMEQCTPEQLENLLQAVDPSSLMYVRGGGRRLFHLANHLAELLGADVEEFTVPKASVPIERVHQEATAQVAA
jgi:hypothetical protein